MLFTAKLKDLSDYRYDSNQEFMDNFWHAEHVEKSESSAQLILLFLYLLALLADCKQKRNKVKNELLQNTNT